MKKIVFLINRIIDNYPGYLSVFLSKSKIKSFDYNKNRFLVDELQRNSKVIDVVKEDVYLDNSMKNLALLDSLDSESEDYTNVYQDIISVGEY